jgi:hypothetical protein
LRAGLVAQAQVGEDGLGRLPWAGDRADRLGPRPAVKPPAAQGNRDDVVIELTDAAGFPGLVNAQPRHDAAVDQLAPQAPPG